MQPFSTAALYTTATRLASAIGNLRTAQQMADVENSSQSKALVWSQTEPVQRYLTEMLEMLPDGGALIVDLLVSESGPPDPPASPTASPEGPF